ncbi:MAG TPA: pentapeptide repeat-containing protein [Chloroflexi bacterium]|nr:pentapeptide repeat-containing protein [Chloroflexota bacterium]
MGVVTRRQTRRRKKDLIRRLRSRDNGEALRAAEMLRAYGWLYDGTLRGANLARASLAGADLSGANLQKAHLPGADLRGADLYQADLEDADLFGADLEGATLEEADIRGLYLAAANLRGTGLTEAELARLSGLVGATMPDGSLYDGRFNLPGDLDPARLEVNDVDNPAAMAEWYGVSLEIYLAGQAWARENLPRLRSD